MAKEPDIEKIIKRVQSDSDKKIDKKLETLSRHLEQKMLVMDKRASDRAEGLLEEFQSRIKAFGEPYVNIGERFDKIDDRFDGIERTLENHTQVLNHHTKILDSHSKVLGEHTKILDSHTERLGSLAMDMTEVKSDVRDIKLQVNFLINNKVDKKHFVDLDLRVRKLENK